MAGTRKLLMMEKAKNAEFIWGFLRQKLSTLQMPQAVDKLTPDFFSADIFTRLLRDIDHFFASIAAKFGELCNPETLAICLRWGVIVALSVVGLVVAFYAFSFIIMILLFLFRLVCQGLFYLFMGLYYCCLFLLKGLFHLFLFLMRGCCGCVGCMGVTMMTAPGTFGLVIIPKCLFLYSPRIFFMVLRSVVRLLGSCAGNMYIVTGFGVGTITMAGLKLAGVF